MKRSCYLSSGIKWRHAPPSQFHASQTSTICEHNLRANCDFTARQLRMLLMRSMRFRRLCPIFNLPIFWKGTPTGHLRSFNPLAPTIYEITWNKINARKYFLRIIKIIGYLRFIIDSSLINVFKCILMWWFLRGCLTRRSV